MNSLTFLIYLSAMGVSILLRRQAKRQKSEIARECARPGCPLPAGRPSIQTLEALLNISIGTVLFVPAMHGFWMIFRSPFFSTYTGPEMGDFYSILLAAGVTLMFLGSKALRQNLLYRKNISQKAPADLLTTGAP